MMLTTTESKLKPGHFEGIVPFVLRLGDRTHTYKLPEIERVAVLYHTDKTVRIECTNGKKVTAPQSNVYCLPDEQAWEKALSLQAEATKALQDIANRLLNFERYDLKLAELGKDAPNPLTSTVIDAPDPNPAPDPDKDWVWYSSSLTPPPIHRKSIKCHTKVMLKETKYGEDWALIRQKGVFTCPSDEDWTALNTLLVAAEACCNNFKAYLSNLGTYEQATRMEVVGLAGDRSKVHDPISGVSLLESANNLQKVEPTDSTTVLGSNSTIREGIRMQAIIETEKLYTPEQCDLTLVARYQGRLDDRNWSPPPIVVDADFQVVEGTELVIAHRNAGIPKVLVEVQELPSVKVQELPSVELDINLIKVDGGTQSREALKQEVVKDYAEAIASGCILPPVDLYYDGSNYWLADGFHRHAAHKLQCLTTIRARVHQGTRRDALLHSVGANAVHGLRRTNADKRRAVELLLKDEEWGKWSDREIARRAKVSHNFVSNLRAICHPMTDTGAGSERTVRRGGTTYPQRTGNIGGRDRGGGSAGGSSKSNTNSSSQWLPKAWERVEVIGDSPFAGKTGEICQALGGGIYLVHLEGEAWNCRERVALRHLKPEGQQLTPQDIVPEPDSKDKQLLPSIPPNPDTPPETPPPLTFTAGELLIIQMRSSRADKSEIHFNGKLAAFLREEGEKIRVDCEGFYLALFPDEVRRAGTQDLLQAEQVQEVEEDGFDPEFILNSLLLNLDRFSPEQLKKLQKAVENELTKNAAAIS